MEEESKGFEGILGSLRFRLRIKEGTVAGSHSVEGSSWGN